MTTLRALPLLASAGFASMVSMRVCDAMLPALAKEFATQPAQAAKVISAFAMTYGLLQLAYGPLGDRFGKPRVISFATLACCIAALASALSPSLGMLTLSRMAMGAAAAGIIPLTMAWIGDQVPYEERQEVLARLLGSTVLGMMAGSWVGGVMAQTVGWRIAFVALAALFGVVAFALRRGAMHDRVDPRSQERPRALRQMKAVLGSSWARRVIAVAFIEGGFVFGSLAFVPNTLHERFQLPLSQAGAVLAVFGLGGLLYSRFARRLLRALGAPWVAAIGAGCLSVAFFLLAVMPHWVLALPACLLAGLGFYMLHNTLQNCATQLSETARGTGVSLFVCALFLGQSAGVACAAAVVGAYSATAWFGLAAAMLLALGAHFGSQLHAFLAHRGATPA